MSFGRGQTVTITTRTRVGQDADGNDTFTEASTVLAGVPVWPGSSTELLDGRDQVTAVMLAWLPIGTVIGPLDKVTLSDGVYEVTGQPKSFSSPFSGRSGKTVTLTKIVG